MNDDKDETIAHLSQECSLFVSMLEEIILDERVPKDLKIRISQLVKLVGQLNFEWAKKHGRMDIYNSSYNEDLK